MPFGQLVIGPPGAGKTTYCNGMQQFLSAIGRKCSVVNLDPAASPFPTSPSSSNRGNNAVGYTPALDIRDLVPLETIMREEGLGPNGGVLYALEALRHDTEWLMDGLKALGEDYVLFDCPGQVEAFTHHSGLRDVVWRVQRDAGYRLVALHLTDSFTLTQPSLYISTLLLSLRTMLQLELPHINVLTKIDKLASYCSPSPPGGLPFNLDFYTQVQDLTYLLPHLAAEGNAILRHPRFEALNRAVVDLIEDFGLVAFETLAVENKRSMMALLRVVDRAGGYAFGGAEGANDTVWQVAMREDAGSFGMGGEGEGGMIAGVDIQERWIDRKDEFDELERREEEEALVAQARTQAQAPARAGGGGQRTDGTIPEADDEDDDDEEEELKAGFGGSQVDGSVKVVRKG